MATVAQALTKAIPGLWRKKANDPNALPAGLGLAPINVMRSNGEYQILTTDTRFDAQDPAQNKAGGDHEAYSQGSLQYGSVAVATQRYLSKMYTIPERVALALESDNEVMDLARDAMEACSSQLLDGWNTEFTSAAIAGLTAGAALDLSAPAATDLVDYFNTEVEGIHLASGKRPNVLLVNAQTAHALRNMDTVQGATALGGADGGGGSTFRRTGYAGFGAVEEFFSAMYGLQVLVDDRTFIDATGTPRYALYDSGTTATYAMLGYADPRGGCMATFSQKADVIDFDVQDLVLPNPRGVGVAADARYKVEVTDPDAGRVIQLTL